eukprot:5836034-Prymnesium_polylepis.1
MAPTTSFVSQCTCCAAPPAAAPPSAAGVSKISIVTSDADAFWSGVSGCGCVAPSAVGAGAPPTGAAPAV